ncbi:hypothetical protein KUCAC02_021485 [Chaenocephalus aceratus]|uniref:Uncharacterized protein n=1 Tax=Chaenocephalus aceratus TaxID=36190 RepID=A0ACB9XHJ5_CHAAC|nr:hypothetical protein KUCAC02_021485 [Chaenocephalus aceratus]
MHISYADTVKTWAEMTKVSETSAPSNFKNIMKEARDEQLKETDDRESRENNLIIYQADESTEETPVEFFDSLCENIFEIGKLQTKQVIRLGTQATQGPKRNRPLKIVLNNRDDKEKIFKNVRKLKNCENKYQRISISNDYNKEDRELIRNKVEEAKAKTAAEESKNSVFRVRGPPWNLRLVKLRKQE